MSARTGPDAVMAERGRLTGLAYRLLGSLAEAEDAVQEAYARWYALSPDQQDAIDSPGAWLTTVARLGPRPARTLRRPVDTRTAARAD